MWQRLTTGTGFAQFFPFLSQHARAFEFVHSQTLLEKESIVSQEGQEGTEIVRSGQIDIAHRGDGTHMLRAQQDVRTRRRGGVADAREQRRQRLDPFLWPARHRGERDGGEGEEGEETHRGGGGGGCGGGDRGDSRCRSPESSLDWDGRTNRRKEIKPRRLE